MHYVYILWSDRLQKSYVGSTQDVGERLRRHNAGHSLATRGGIPWRLMRVEALPSRSEAIMREKYLKTGRGREERDRILAQCV